MTSSRSPLLQRAAISLVGGAVAVVMIILGLWQMQVFEQQGNKDAFKRSTAEAVQLVPLIPRDGSVGDVYGRNVRVRGTFRAVESDIYAGAGGNRVVTALILDDGRAVPVVRGVCRCDQPPAPPDGVVEMTGVFLPSEARGRGGDTDRPLRLPELQQRWSEQLAPGFVTLNAAEATAQGLEPGPVALPSQDGKFRNFGYALQWWVFAGFAVVMTVVWVRTLRQRERAAQQSSRTA